MRYENLGSNECEFIQQSVRSLKASLLWNVSFETIAAAAAGMVNAKAQKPFLGEHAANHVIGFLHLVV